MKKIIHIILGILKRSAIFLGTFLLYHIIFSPFFPVDENNYLIAPDWFVWVGLALAVIVAFFDKMKTGILRAMKKTPVINGTVSQESQIHESLSEEPTKEKHVRNSQTPAPTNSRMAEFISLILIAVILIALIAISSQTVRLFILILIIPIWKIYEFSYFKGTRFQETKDRIYTYIKDCNDLNAHIGALKDTSLVINRRDYGIAEYKDTSSWNVKRPELKNLQNSPNVYHCSRTVCDNARRDPFKYICKYFGIAVNEESLVMFETILNNFEAVEEGKEALKTERERILASIGKDVPFLIQKLSKKKLEQKLGFDAVDFRSLYFPRYTFKYTSSGGNTSTQCDVVMDIRNLNDFIHYLAERIKFNKSAAGQRALMTSKLRQEIKERDNFTCRYCGISVRQEPHLLLEIDHIVPIARGGQTSPDNLQTLCWKCNRSKGSKLPSAE